MLCLLNLPFFFLHIAYVSGMTPQMTQEGSYHHECVKLLSPKAHYSRCDSGTQRGESGNSDHHHPTSVSLFFSAVLGLHCKCAGCSLWHAPFPSGFLTVLCQLSCPMHVGSRLPDQRSDLHPCTESCLLSSWTTREGPPLESLGHPEKREWMLQYCNTGAEKPYNSLQGLLDSKTYSASRNSYKWSLGN